MKDFLFVGMLLWGEERKKPKPEHEQLVSSIQDIQIHQTSQQMFSRNEKNLHEPEGGEALLCFTACTDTTTGARWGLMRRHIWAVCCFTAHKASITK